MKLNLYQKYTKTIRTFVATISSDDNIIACFVSGSYARKDLSSFSDIDLYVLVKDISHLRNEWLLFEDIFFSIKYYTQEDLKKEIDFSPKTFVEFSKSFEHVEIIHDPSGIIPAIVSVAIENANKLTKNHDKFKDEISKEFSLLAEEICKVANALERNDMEDFAMVSFFTTIDLINCLQMANKTQLIT